MTKRCYINIYNYAYSSICGLPLSESSCSSEFEWPGGVEGRSSRGLRYGTFRTLIREGRTVGNRLILLNGSIRVTRYLQRFFTKYRQFPVQLEQEIMLSGLSRDWQHKQVWLLPYRLGKNHPGFPGLLQ